MVHNRKNLGIGATRQQCANYAEGDYIAFLSSDDVYASDFLEKCIPCLGENQATYVDYYQCDSRLKPLSTFKPPIASKENIAEWALKKNMFINFSGIIVPKRIFEEVKFETRLKHGEDLVFLLDTVIAKLEWIHVSKPLLYYRIHQSMGTKHETYEDWSTLWELMKDRLLKLGVSESKISESYKISYKTRCPSPMVAKMRQIGKAIGLKRVRDAARRLGLPTS